MPKLSSLLEFYAQPGAMSKPGKYTEPLRALPREVGELSRIIQGLFVHSFVAADWYDVKQLDQRQDECHLRRIDAMLDRLFELDAAPIEQPRPPQRRLLVVCRHYALLLTTILRVQGVPARVRCGFATYFNPPYFEDHWVCEYFDAGQARWIQVDTQLDDIWRQKLGLDFDPLDVPRDRFLIAGEAWRRCSEGRADPSKFGINQGNLRGLWFIAGDLVRDAAALGKVEMLPWDVWGSQPQVDQEVGADAREFFDLLAELTRAPDENIDRLRALQADDRVRAPHQVFNANRQRNEPV
jgi:hypothetical protein